MSTPRERTRRAIGFVRSLVTSIPQTSRSLRRSPGFVAIATLSLGAALGMSTSVFALIDAMAHPNSAFSHVEQLFEVRVFGNAKISPSAKDVHDAVVAIPGVARLVTATEEYADVEAGETVTRVAISRTRPGFFEMLGAHARIGRMPSPQDAQGQNAAVVSDDFWRSQFANRSDISGAQLSIKGHQYSIIGVLAPHADAPINTSIWIPLAASATDDYGIPYVRLRPGITEKDVQPQLTAIMARMTRVFVGPGDKPFAASFVTLEPNPLALKDFHRAMVGAAVCVLLIACANVAALLLARGVVRRRDYALRLALGASRSDIAREVIVEVAALAVIGAIAGAIVATWAVGLMTRAQPVEMTWLGFVAPQWSVRVLASSGLAVVLAIAIAGGVPAWQASRTDPAGTLKDSSGGNTGRAARRFRWLVMAELALSMTLTVGASLMLKSVTLMAHYNFGIDTKNLLTAQVYLYNRLGKMTGSELDDGLRDGLARVRALPGVESAALVSSCQFDHPILTTDRTIEGGAPLTMPMCTNVSSDYFRTLGYSFAEGRDFTAGDVVGGGAVVLDQKTAHKLFPHESAIGRMVKLGDLASKKPWLTVVGVVRNRVADFEPFPERGVDSSEVMFATSPDTTRDTRQYQIRLSPGAHDVRVSVSHTLTGALPPKASIVLIPWTHKYDVQLGEERFLALVFTLLGVASLVLGAAGLFSVISYIASQRMREFAVRVALGATRQSVAGLVLYEAILMALGGTAAGAGFGMWGGFLIWDKMYGVYPVDAGALIAAEVTLILTTMIACLAPALRAMRADPVTVMRAT